MAKAQIATLEQEISALRIDKKYFETNNDRLQFYTGLPNIETLDAVFELIEPYILKHHKVCCQGLCSSSFF